MQRHYRVDLTDLWRGRLSLRRLRVLVDHLPPDSATAYAVVDEEGQDLSALRGWRLTDVLLARLADELAIYRWQWESAHLDKKARPRQQPPSVLPEVKTKRPDRESVPVVSPHRLGSFVNEQEENPHGY